MGGQRSRVGTGWPPVGALFVAKADEWGVSQPSLHGLLQLLGGPKRNLPLAPDMDDFAGL